MLDQISQVAIMLLGAISIILIAKKNKWGFVTGLISQPFWIATSLINEQWGVFINSILFTGSWLYGIYEWFYKNNKSAETKNNAMKSINIEKANSLIEKNKDNPDFIILDVRTSDEFQAGHIENAMNIDFYSDSFREELTKLDKNKTYLIYCRSGHRSKNTLKIMEKISFEKVYNMQGGITAWENSNYPIAK